MMDSRMEKLAHGLVNYSTRVQPGDNVLISAANGCEMLIKALDTSFFSSQTEHRVLDNMIRYASSAELAAEFRVLSNRQTFVARQNYTFSIRQLIFELSDDSLFFR